MPDDPRYNTRRWQDTRRKARERDGNCCVVCGSIRNLSVDHIVAITDDPCDENFY
jgi:5-methylcytosine-specific restriction endonuclease McrA